MLGVLCRFYFFVVVSTLDVSYTWHYFFFGTEISRWWDILFVGVYALGVFGWSYCLDCDSSAIIYEFLDLAFFFISIMTTVIVGLARGFLFGVTGLIAAFVGALVLHISFIVIQKIHSLYMHYMKS